MRRYLYALELVAAVVLIPPTSVDDASWTLGLWLLFVFESWVGIKIIRRFW